MQLNVNSAVLWAEILDKCNLTIVNTLTDQIETLPVNIVLRGNLSKATRSSKRKFTLIHYFYKILFLQSLMHYFHTFASNSLKIFFMS